MLDMGLPFGLEWFSFTFKELVTFVFYLVIGYKFRPVEDSPFFGATSNSEESEEEVVFEIPEITHRKKSTEVSATSYVFEMIVLLFEGKSIRLVPSILLAIYEDKTLSLRHQIQFLLNNIVVCQTGRV
jgi:hypothetical protein